MRQITFFSLLILSFVLTGCLQQEQGTPQTTTPADKTETISKPVAKTEPVDGTPKEAVQLVEKLGSSYKLTKEEKEILKAKENAVTALTIDSNTFLLDAHVWRDFMPPSPKDGEPMISINRLIDKNKVKIPDNISMVKQYVIYKDKFWIADYTGEKRGERNEYLIEKVSRNGPKWDTGINVDVISQIYDSNTNEYYYVEQKGVRIHKTL